MTPLQSEVAEQMACEADPRVRVLERIRVSPLSPPSDHDPAALPLTFFDVAWLVTGPVERLFFFRHADPASAVPLLRSSLFLALRRFYPLAGTIGPSPATPATPFVCSYSHGAADGGLSFVVAESDRPADFDRLVGRDPRDLALIRPLVPQLQPPGEDGAFAVAAVQATVFPGRGLCVGVSVHHAACDDASAMHFVRTWAAACRDAPATAMPPPPVMDRSLVADPDDLRGKTLAGMMGLAPPPPPPPQEEKEERGPLVMASFLLSREQIDRIKAASGSGDPPPSSFVAASALAWVCLLGSGSAGVAGAERSHMLFSAECRSRLAPPLPAEYFGNCLRPCFVEAATADLLRGETGVAAAAAAIVAAIREMERSVLDGAEAWLGKVMSVLPARPMSVGGSPRHGVYLDTDFGWGRPVRVEMVSVEKTPGTVALAESPEGDGGMELGVVLPRDAMDAFASCFAHGLAA